MRPRAFNPLPDDHPSVGELCALCNQPMQAGDVPTLIATGPADEEEAAKAAAGRAYTAIAAVAHWTCFLSAEAELEAGERDPL